MGVSRLRRFAPKATTRGTMLRDREVSEAMRKLEPVGLRKFVEIARGPSEKGCRRGADSPGSEANWRRLDLQIRQMAVRQKRMLWELHHVLREVDAEPLERDLLAEGFRNACELALFNLDQWPYVRQLWTSGEESSDPATDPVDSVVSASEMHQQRIQWLDTFCEAFDSWALWFEATHMPEQKSFFVDQFWHALQKSTTLWRMAEAASLCVEFQVADRQLAAHLETHHGSLKPNPYYVSNIVDPILGHHTWLGYCQFAEDLLCGRFKRTVDLIIANEDDEPPTKTPIIGFGSDLGSSEFAPSLLPPGRHAGGTLAPY